MQQQQIQRAANFNSFGLPQLQQSHPPRVHLVEFVGTTSIQSKDLTSFLKGQAAFGRPTISKLYNFDVDRNRLSLAPDSGSPSNTIPFRIAFSLFPYPIQLDDDAWLALLVSIVTVGDARALLQDGAVELTGALGVVLHIAAVLLQEVLVRGALVVLLGLH